MNVMKPIRVSKKEMNSFIDYIRNSGWTVEEKDISDKRSGFIYYMSNHPWYSDMTAVATVCYDGNKKLYFINIRVERKIDHDLANVTSFEPLRKTLLDLPATWYPALLQALVEGSYSKGTWLPGGASRFVKGIEEKYKWHRKLEEHLQSVCVGRMVELSMKRKRTKKEEKEHDLLGKEFIEFLEALSKEINDADGTPNAEGVGQGDSVREVPKSDRCSVPPNCQSSA